MSNTCKIGFLLVWVISAMTGLAAELVKAKDGSGVYGYKDTPKLPWCDWLVHDPDRPAPPRVDPGKPTAGMSAPSDAILLLGGSNLDQWVAAPEWKLDGAELVSGKGNFTTKAEFGDIQLHLEWMGPKDFPGPWYNQGNSGVSLMGLFEIQIFDSLKEKIYPDGQCAAIYGQTPPLVNATRPAGEWQTYDLIFQAPRFQQGRLVSPARVTVFHNGVLVHANHPIFGETGHRILPAYTKKTEKGPIVLSGHDCPVRFRNIWVRELKLQAQN
jgi:hypothetical protein